MSQQPTLSLERFATLMAKVAHFGRSDQAEVLERCGIAPGLWRESRRHWLEHLTKTDGDDLHEFGKHFARTALGLDLVMPALSDLGPLSRDMTLNPDEPATLMADSVDPATVMRSVAEEREYFEKRERGTDALAKLPSSTPSRVKEPLVELDSTLASSISPVRGPAAEISSVPPTSSSPAPPSSGETDLAATILEAPAGIAPHKAPSPPASNGAPTDMTPEQYARLAHATHAAPSVMRERVHHELGIRDEGHRSQLDRAMMARFNAEPATYQVYMQWVSYLRSGGS